MGRVLELEIASVAQRIERHSRQWFAKRIATVGTDEQYGYLQFFELCQRVDLGQFVSRGSPIATIYAVTGLG